MDRITTFYRPLDLRRLARNPPTVAYQRANFEKVLNLLVEQGRDRALQEVLRETLATGARSPITAWPGHFLSRLRNYFAYRFS